MPFHRTSQLVELGIDYERVRQKANQTAAGGKQVEADIQKKRVTVAIAEFEKLTRFCNAFKREREWRICQNPVNLAAKVS